MSLRHIILYMAFACLSASPYVFEVAYYGYLIAFTVIALTSFILYNKRHKINYAFKKSNKARFLLILVPFIIFQTLIHANEFRDIIRDIGALIAFFVGFIAIPRLFSDHKSDWRVGAIQALSNVGVFIALITLIGAGQAYLDGVQAYFWRGEYVPFAHSWLPYFFVINLGLSESDATKSRRYLLRALLCLIGSASSLSRTDIGLYFLFYFIILIFQYNNKNSRRALYTSLILFAVASPFIGKLDVIQERMGLALDASDPSLSWRFIENEAFANQFTSADLSTKLFGEGLGGRLYLPSYTLDFDGNDSIPHLHNSFFTIIMKFGIFGIAALFIYIIFYIKKANSKLYSAKNISRYTTLGIIYFILGKAVTLQGLTEWSHLLFFGFSSALVFEKFNRDENLKNLIKVT